MSKVEVSVRCLWCKGTGTIVKQISRQQSVPQVCSVCKGTGIEWLEVKDDDITAGAIESK